MALGDDQDCWRVGVLFSQSGVTSAIERTQLNATLLAIEEINAGGGVLGRRVEPVLYDPASDPKKFRAFADRLFQVDRVRLLFGCYMSSTRKAVLPVVEAHRGLLSIRRCMRASSIRATASTPAPRPIRIRCSSRVSCCRPTAIASCSSAPTMSTLTNPTA